MKKFLIGVTLIGLATLSLFFKTYVHNNETSKSYDREWYEWYTSLTPEQQSFISYRPFDFFEKQQTTEGAAITAEPVSPPRDIKDANDTINIIGNQEKPIAIPPSQNMSEEDNIPMPTPTPTVTPFR